MIDRHTAFETVEREYMELARQHGRIVLYVYPDRVEGCLGESMRWADAETLVGIVDELKSPKKPLTIKELLELPKDEG